MADSAYTKKAPCVGFFTPFDPTTCEPLTVTHVFKLAVTRRSKRPPNTPTIRTGQNGQPICRSADRRS